MRFHRKIGAILLGLVVASGFVVAGSAPSVHAARFNPQPDPPGFAGHSALRGAHGPQQNSFSWGLRP
jgi:hypothetical protein